MNYRITKKKWRMKRAKYGKYETIKLKKAWIIMRQDRAIPHFLYKCDKCLKEHKSVGAWHFSFPYIQLRSLQGSIA